MRVRFGSALCVVAALGLGACDKSEITATASKAPSTASAAWVLASLPEGAVDIHAAKQTVKEGDQVVLRGRIGGRVDPISKDAAVFIVMDPAVPACDAKGDDHCAVPWDYCCETPQTIQANNATVQVIDASGATVPVDVQSLGFKPLDTVVIVGTVGPRPTPEILTIKASGVFRVGG